MAKQSQLAMHKWTGFSRDAIRARFDRFGLGKTADPREVIQLKPLDDLAKSGTLEEARKRQAEADAHLKELQAQKLQAELASVDDIRGELASLFEQFAAEIRKSQLDEGTKQDMLEQMTAYLEKW